MSYNVFVYGTLKEGFGNNRLLRGRAEKVRDDTLSGYKMYSMGAFPFIVPTGNEEDVVNGEVWYVPDEHEEEVEASLDMLEGYPNFYNKHTVYPDGGHEYVDVYFMDTALKGYPQVPSGNWG